LDGLFGIELIAAVLQSLFRTERFGLAQFATA
jgi:hypothetical protein